MRDADQPCQDWEADLCSRRAPDLTATGGGTTSQAPNAGEIVAIRSPRRRRSNRPGNSQAKGPRGQVLWRAADIPYRAPKGVSPESVRAKSLRLDDRGGRVRQRLPGPQVRDCRTSRRSRMTAEPVAPGTLRQTPLAAAHRRLGARI